MSSTDYSTPGLALFGEPVTVVGYIKPDNNFQQEIANEHGVLCVVAYADHREAITLTGNLQLVAA
ncbi:hypothetical protein ACFYVR_15805 [Rhodococcus sp. NPDC003318]|uniref:hypothetical protein n=1 Tax=Rhodococcus sp. NPDC003318 TaxID=3364503 RepID=UPI00367C8324